MLKDAGNLFLTCGIVIFIWWIFDFSPARVIRKVLFNTPIYHTPESFLGMVFMGIIDIISWLVVIVPLLAITKNILQ